MTPMTPDPGSVTAAVADAYRSQWGQVLATVARLSRDLDVAEDCTQDAFTQALLCWGRDGIPASPGAWLTTVAVRQALQRMRRAATLARKLPDLAAIDDNTPDDLAADRCRDSVVGTVFEHLPDDRLRLVFTCCHPALSAEARVALTLRLVCGLTSAEVAKGFLVKEATMQARITRAKRKIAEAGIPYRVPERAELPERLDSVLDTVQLVYNAGHVAPSGPTLMREDLADRAVQLARMLHDLLPREGESRALLAWLLLTDARRAARVGAEGELVPLEEQDRAAWDRAAIVEGLELLRECLHTGARGRYTVMACIAAVHDEATAAADTDWQQIVQLYDVLLQRWPSPVVALNRAIAVGAGRDPTPAWRPWTPWPTNPTWPDIPTCRPHEQTSCAAPARWIRQPMPTARRYFSPPTRSRSPSCSADSPKHAPRHDPLPGQLLPARSRSPVESRRRALWRWHLRWSRFRFPTSTGRRRSTSNDSDSSKTSMSSQPRGERVVQLTPPGSACSIGLGAGLPACNESPPGSVNALHLVVRDIEPARTELIGHDSC